MVDSDATGRPHPRSVARLLGERTVQSVLIEGGPTLAGAWWDAGLIDRIMAFVAPKLAGGMTALPPLWATGAARMDEAVRLQDLHVQEIEGDVLVTGFVTEPY